jgi:hypothetical protein
MTANDIVAIQAILSRVVEGYRVLDPVLADAGVAPPGAPALWLPASRTLH